MGILGFGLKVAKTIKSVKPGTTFKGGKTVKQWQSDITNKKFHDAIRGAGAQITGKLKKTAAELEKLTKTLKKQKKIYQCLKKVKLLKKVWVNLDLAGKNNGKPKMATYDRKFKKTSKK